MKKLSKLKLNALSDANLQDREMNTLKGGNISRSCGCGCHGSSSEQDNAQQNSNYGYAQSYGGNVVCAYWYDKNGDGKFTGPDELTQSSTN